MTEFADIFATGLTTAVYVCGSIGMLAAYGLFVLSLWRPSRAVATRQAFGTS